MSDYNDIIGMAHHRSAKHTPIPLCDRAAQFAPFAALSGYGEAVEETARLTDNRIEMDESRCDYLNICMQKIIESIEKQPEIIVTYFKPDGKKTGGSYEVAAGKVKRIDQYEGVIIFTDGTEVDISSVSYIESEIFSQSE